MGTVIRAADLVGFIGWVQPMNDRGFRTIGGRDSAERFSDPVAAANAIDRMPAIFAGMGLEYTVESLPETAK